jgi:hypothetical protein
MTRVTHRKPWIQNTVFRLWRSGDSNRVMVLESVREAKTQRAAPLDPGRDWQDQAWDGTGEAFDWGAESAMEGRYRLARAILDQVLPRDFVERCFGLFAIEVVQRLPMCGCDLPAEDVAYWYLRYLTGPELIKQLTGGGEVVDG